jgi:3-deoxy-D-manno-octulosonate 8-phosphate phosphatase (KDO 8-P phosphatase)
MKPSLTTNFFSDFPQAIERAQCVKLLVLDVDGVLTDGSLMISPDGLEHIKVFDSLDGHGLKLIISKGIQVAIISGRKSSMVEMRAKALGIQHVFLGIEDKKSIFLQLIKTLNLTPRDCGAIGDDWPDLGVLNVVHFSAAPANAHPEVSNIADYVCRKKGGEGAVREVCDLILLSQNFYYELLSQSLE